MADYGSFSYETGGLGGTPFFGTPVNNPDQAFEYISTGPGRFTPKIPQIIESEFDDVTRNFGFRVLEAMITDPAVSSSYLALKLSILAGPLKVQPAVRPKGYRDGKSYAVDATAGKISPRESRAIEISEFCNREMRRNRQTSFKSTLNQLLDKMIYGCKLAEKTREEVKFGPDKGKLGLKSVNVKPHWAWKFVVDKAMQPVYILTWVPPDVTSAADFTGGYALIPISKFILSTWLPKDGDPRGTSALRPAYDWWNLKRQCMPFYYQHLRRFGSPSLDGVVSPKDVGVQFPIDPTTGLEITSQPKVSAVQRYTQALIAFQNNSVIVRPAESELNVLEPKSNGESFLSAFSMFDNAICLAITLNARTSLEAKHGSKADSETATDTRSLVTDYGKEELGEEVSRQIFYESVVLNFGEDDAEEFTPTLLVGSTEKQDRAAMWTAAASVGFAIGQSQLEEMDVELDLPERDAEADAQAASDAMQQQADMMAKVAPQGKPGSGKSGAAGGKSGGKPPSAPGGQGGKPKPAPAKPAGGGK